ncbi:hypothetical protein [Vibrio salinus]|uniref:hypothetical protein n=1 Tax=Vibrio salinus TaxID=2899784 RepID=UPI001E5D78F1|nr:hypothetical protein [Vibrio salinus]MCE0494428.1 hypothetical protein [Vibrio salinus]
MARFEKYVSLIIFTVLVLAFSVVNGYRSDGDTFEKIINGVGMLESLLVLVALFGIYKGKGAELFPGKQLKLLAYGAVIITFLTYFYPLFRYSEQNSRDFMSTFVYDVVLNIIIFILLIKESRK